RHGTVDPQWRAGGRGWHGRRRAAGRAGAHQRSRHRRHAACARGLRRGARPRPGDRPRPARDHDVTVTLVPEVVLDATGVHRDLAVLVDPDDGTTEGLIGATHAPDDGVRLPRTALAPGFVNGHSHSFQRDLRGVVERVSHLAPEDDFWTWRTAM